MITAEILKRIAPLGKPALLEGFANTLSEEGAQWGLTDVRAIRHFIAQCAHESDGFKTFEEYASGQAYEGRRDLGNTLRGDGMRFKGRGPIQITGRANYHRASEGIGVDYVANPEWASGPINGTRIAMWYWHDRGLTELALKDEIVAITKRVNGGTNGLSSRQSYLNRCLKHIPDPTPIAPPEPPKGWVARTMDYIKNKVTT